MNKDLIEKVVQEVIEKVNIKNGYHYPVPIGISNHHVHLSKEDVERLFGKGYQLTLLKELTQTGEFACHEQVDLVHGNRIIKNVRILGPTRKQTQVEISQTDARILKLSPKVRNSGDLSKTDPITLRTTTGEVNLKEGLIIATRHLHLTTSDANRYGVKNNEQVSIRIRGEKSGVIDAVTCKVNDAYVLELHLDTDDGNAFLATTGDIAELIR